MQSVAISFLLMCGLWIVIFATVSYRLERTDTFISFDVYPDSFNVFLIFVLNSLFVILLFLHAGLPLTSYKVAALHFLHTAGGGAVKGAQRQGGDFPKGKYDPILD